MKPFETFLIVIAGVALGLLASLVPTKHGTYLYHSTEHQLFKHRTQWSWYCAPGVVTDSPLLADCVEFEHAGPAPLSIEVGR